MPGTINTMVRRTLDEKIYGPAQQTMEDVRLASRKLGDAAEAQAVLMIALTVVAVTALLVAASVARKVQP